MQFLKVEITFDRSKVGMQTQMPTYFIPIDSVLVMRKYNADGGYILTLKDEVRESIPHATEIIFKNDPKNIITVGQS